MTWRRSENVEVSEARRERISSGIVMPLWPPCLTLVFADHLIKPLGASLFMTEWIKSHVNLADHPKVFTLSRTLSVPVPYVIGTLHLLWWYGMRYSWKDGDVSRYGAQGIATACKWDKDPEALVTALQEAGFLDGLKIHDWLDFAGRLVKDRIRYSKANKIRTQPVRNTDVSRTLPVAKSSVVKSRVEEIRETTPRGDVSKPYERPDKVKDPTGFLVLTYKEGCGFAYDDRDWDKRFWGRWAHEAKVILDKIGGVDDAISFIDHHAKEYNKRGTKWTLKTVADRAVEYSAKEKHDTTNR